MAEFGFGHGNPNRYRNEIQEFSTQIATLNDKVQLFFLKRRVASLIKKVHHLLPPSEGSSYSQSQLDYTFDYKEKNIDDDLVESYVPLNSEEFEGEMNFTQGVFEEVKELG